MNSVVPNDWEMRSGHTYDGPLPLRQFSAWADRGYDSLRIQGISDTPRERGKWDLKSKK